MAQMVAERAVTAPLELAPCIAFSRKIGIGALEIADIVAQIIGYQVADRDVIEQIASHAKISEESADYFDERFPGYVNRTFKYLFGKKAAAPYEFDMVMNLDHLVNPRDVADIITLAFNKKFKTAV